MINKPVSDLVRDDLVALVDNAVSESKTIEYKIALPGNSYDEKKEFLSDLSSFANASGGHLIYGIREEAGVAVELTGLSDIDVEAEILRLENMIRDNIDPRIPGVSIGSVPVGETSAAIVIFVPDSWAGPHVVQFQRHWRFYSRTSAGKYPLDVAELRSAFLSTQNIVEMMRSFRNDRLSRIIADETPVQLEGRAKLVLHLVPLSISDPTQTFGINKFVTEQQARLIPINSSGWIPRFNFDGFLVYSPGSQAESSHTYLQLFRHGSIEAVETALLGKTYGDTDVPSIPSIAFEREILEALSRFVAIQKDIGVSAPILLMISLIGVRGYIIATSQSLMFLRGTYPIERNNLILPEIVVDDFRFDPSEILRPAFDAIWNAAGWPSSMNYNEKGKWKPRR